MKRFILWDYPRASWQYDAMVALILAFIFLTPRVWFRDQPRANKIVMLPSEHGSGVFMLDPDLLNGLEEGQRVHRAGELLKTHTGGKRFSVTRVEPIFDSEQEIKGFMAYTKP
ncbi:MAG: hypothetical protein ACK5AZ_05970 [Bryobacteraceae bacterium]